MSEEDKKPKLDPNAQEEVEKVIEELKKGGLSKKEATEQANKNLPEQETEQNNGR